MPNLVLPRFSPKSKKTQKGQVVIEYILLLVVALSLATLIMSQVVKRDSDEPGFLMQRWQGLLDQIGKDDPNKRGS